MDVGLSEAEFRAVFERHSPELLRFAIRCVTRRDVAEEITSEAFLRMHQNRDRIEPARAAAWLTAAIRNLAIDYWRREAVERKHSEALAPRPALQAGEDIEAMLSHPDLNASHRVCLSLHYVHGMDRKEISAHTGLNDNQVKSAIQYGLRLLRKAMGGKGGGQ